MAGGRRADEEPMELSLDLSDCSDEVGATKKPCCTFVRQNNACEIRGRSFSFLVVLTSGVRTDAASMLLIVLVPIR